MNIKTLAVNACLIVFIVSGAAVSFAQTPQAFSWSTTPPNVASVSWTNEQIATFLDTVTSSSVDIAVSDFRFVDLDADGQLELVAGIDLSGRGEFNSVAVVRRTGANFAVQEIRALGVDSLDGILSDVNNDGKQELLIPTAVTPYLGTSAPEAEWTAVYGWSGPLLIDISVQLPSFYQTAILPGLKQNLDALQASQPGSIDVDIAQISYDKTLRISNTDPNAGFAQAIAWSSSTDAIHRILASAVLADIGTPAALSALKTLTTDADPEVVIYATGATQSIADLHFARVGIEIKPGGGTASINPTSKGKIPVAILSAPNFNAVGSVDTSSLTFGSLGTEDSLVLCNSNGEDVNGDGLLDLVCHFDTQGSAFQNGDASGTLRGKLKDGSAIKGSAPVNVLSQP